MSNGTSPDQPGPAAEKMRLTVLRRQVSSAGQRVVDELMRYSAQALRIAEVMTRTTFSDTLTLGAGTEQLLELELALITGFRHGEEHALGGYRQVVRLVTDTSAIPPGPQAANRLRWFTEPTLAAMRTLLGEALADVLSLAVSIERYNELLLAYTTGYQLGEEHIISKHLPLAQLENPADPTTETE